MTDFIKTITIHTTRAGNAAITENGGGATNTGHATIVCDRDGQPMRPIWTGRHSNGTHGIFPVHSGKEYFMIVAHNWTKRGGVYEIEVWHLTNRHRHHDEDGTETWKMDACKIRRRLDGEWDELPPSMLHKAIEAAIRKSRCYHCRCLHYADTTKD